MRDPAGPPDTGFVPFGGRGAILVDIHDADHSDPSRRDFLYMATG
ncbi:MAG: hypothetical protein J0H63_07610, partial [Rhizobiales bacterium]|nr:hypothetical protein [Hyphomicrobiales bacterium]